MAVIIQYIIYRINSIIDHMYDQLASWLGVSVIKRSWHADKNAEASQESRRIHTDFCCTFLNRETGTLLSYVLTPLGQVSKDIMSYNSYIDA